MLRSWSLSMLACSVMACTSARGTLTDGVTADASHGAALDASKLEPEGEAGTGSNSTAADATASDPASDAAATDAAAGATDSAVPDLPDAGDAPGDCSAGYTGTPGDCIDIDECATDNGGCDALTACINTDGAYECGGCPEGFVDADESSLSACAWDSPELAMLAAAELPGVALAPAFDAAVTEYALRVPLSVEALALVATLPEAAFGRATVELAGVPLESGVPSAEIPLALGVTSLELAVTTESGAQRRYTLVVERARLFEAHAKASNAEARDYFGFSLALSADGSTLAVGAVDEDGALPSGKDGAEDSNDAREAGAVYVFARDAAGAWAQQAYIKPKYPDIGDRFGTALALSRDGSTLIVGSPGEDGAGSGVDPDNEDDDSLLDAGAAYVFVRTLATWSQLAYVKGPSPAGGAALGTSVALSADGATLVVGAPSYPGGGTATSYTRLADRWSLIAASYPGAGEGSLGGAVALAGNAGTFAVTSNAQGGTVVRVFERSAEGWSPRWEVQLDQRLSFPGSGFALSGDGGTLAVGDPSDPRSTPGIAPEPPAAPGSAHFTGAVHVFATGQGGWARQAFIQASNAEAGDSFGQAVALSRDGSVLAVGAIGESSGAGGVASSPPLDDEDAVAAGAAYVFRRGGSGWAEGEFVKAPTPDSADAFGWSVALSADGHRLAAGALQEDSEATGVATPPIPEDDNAPESGAVFLYH